MRVLAAIASTLPAMAHAHVAGAQHLGWPVEPWVMVSVVIAAGMYAIGLARLWSRAGRGSGIRPGQALAFACGIVVLVLALCSPLEALSDALFAAHMVQHELLMVVAAPLLVLGRPLAVWAWTLPARSRPHAGDALRSAIIAVPWRAITTPLGAFTVHALALWLWHVPALFDAALANDAVHALQHASFLLTAVLFWWSVLPERGSDTRDGVAVVYLFATMIHTGALGALLSLATSPWYATTPSAARAWGLTGLEDQQLGGLIMWIPAGTVYVAVALMLTARWLRAAGSRAARQASAQ